MDEAVRLGIELVEQPCERRLAGQTGRSSGLKIDRRLLHRASSSGAVDFPPPRIRKRSAMLHHHRIVGRIEIFAHGETMHATAAKSHRPSGGGVPQFGFKRPNGSIRRWRPSLVQSAQSSCTKQRPEDGGSTRPPDASICETPNGAPKESLNGARRLRSPCRMRSFGPDGRIAIT